MWKDPSQTSTEVTGSLPVTVHALESCTHDIGVLAPSIGKPVCTEATTDQAEVTHFSSGQHGPPTSLAPQVLVAVLFSEFTGAFVEPQGYDVV